MISWTDLITDRGASVDSTRFSTNDNRKTATLPNYRYSPENNFLVVVWNATSRCNLRCRHCYFDAGPPGKDTNELSHEEAKDFIEDLKSFKRCVLLFSGGEPLLREDIFELAKFAKDGGITPLLSTNGTLITQNIAKKIKKAHFSYVGISLDGLEDINDRFRRKKGAFRQAVRGIKNCQKAGLKVGVRFTITRRNFRCLPGIFDLVEKYNIPRLCFYHLVCIGRGNNLRNEDVSHEERRKILELIWQRVSGFYRKRRKTEVLTVDNHADGVWIYLRLKKENPSRARKVLELLKLQGGNSSGIKIGALDNIGNIYPDQFFRTHALGNIRKKKFSVVWQDKENKFLQGLRNRRPLLKGRCKRCNFLHICNGNFRARAEALSSDPWAEDPGCYLSDEEIGL